MLGRGFPLPAPVRAAAVVRALAEDHDGVWRRPWIGACALMAAAGLAEVGQWPLDLKRWTDELDEDGIIHETMAGLGRREALRHA